jgi:hypothetical protein
MMEAAAAAGGLIVVSAGDDLLARGAQHDAGEERFTTGFR